MNDRLNIFFIIVVSLALYYLFTVASQMPLINRWKAYSSAWWLILSAWLHSDLSLLVHLKLLILSLTLLFLILIQTVSARLIGSKFPQVAMISRCISWSLPAQVMTILLLFLLFNILEMLWVLSTWPQWVYLSLHIRKVDWRQTRNLLQVVGFGELLLNLAKFSYTKGESDGAQEGVCFFLARRLNSQSFRNMFL